MQSVNVQTLKKIAKNLNSKNYFFTKQTQDTKIDAVTSTSTFKDVAVLIRLFSGEDECVE